VLFRTFDQFQQDPTRALITIAVFILALAISITFHEFNHAFVATRLGDSLPKRQGRLSLHPFAHLDPMGTMMILVAGFGWGKPVMVNPHSLSTGPRAGMAVVSLAGPLSNFVVAAIAAIPIKVGLVSMSFVGFGLFRGGPEDLIPYFLGSVISLNIILAAFNLLPIAPLDGFKVALGILPKNMAASFARLEQYGPIILFGLIFLGILIPGRSIITTILTLPMNLMSQLILGENII